MPTRTINVFFAHSTALSRELIQQSGQTVTSLISSRFKSRFPIDELKIRITSGRHDFENYFVGDWEAWASGVPLRVDAMTGRLRYDIFIIHGREIDRATALIADAAIGAQRQLFLYDGESLSKIIAVEAIDPENWKAGWSVVTKERANA